MCVDRCSGEGKAYDIEGDAAVGLIERCGWVWWRRGGGEAEAERVWAWERVQRWRGCGKLVCWRDMEAERCSGEGVVERVWWRGCGGGWCGGVLWRDAVERE